MIELLQSNQELPAAFREHSLTAEYAALTECHLDADWLLIYQVHPDRIVLHRTGRHGDLFRRRRPQ